MIMYIVVAILFFVLGVLAVIGLALVAENYKLGRKEMANATWMEATKEKPAHWQVNGRYLAIAEDITRRLKNDPETVKYNRIK